MEEEYLIESYSAKGHGLASPKTGKRLVEVPRTLKGERVCARLMGRKKSYKRAELTDIIQVSASRQTPKCPHFSICGGCSWQHMHIGAQLQTKKDQIEALFKCEPASVIPSEDEWHYRNKMEYTFSSGHFESLLGLLPFSRRLAFNVTDCKLTSGWMNEVLKSVRLFWEESGLLAFNFRSAEGALRALTLRESKTTGDKMAILTLSGDPRFALSRSELNAFVEAVQRTSDVPISIFMRIWQSVRGQPTRFFTMHLSGPEVIEERYEAYEDLSPLTLKIGPEAFFQPNTFQARAIASFLYQYVKARTGKTLLEQEGSGKKRLVDLYCGLGFFGLQLAPLFDEVIGIECVKEAIIDARINAEINNIQNCRFEALDAAEGLKGLLGSSTIDTLIIDPPREGCEMALETIIKANPQTILYVSCNPRTQVKDIASLQEAGWQLKVLQPFDQFPHTPHIENVAILER